MDFDVIDVFEKRHSFYSINNNLDATNEEIKALILRNLDIYPSSFNAQESRIILLLNQQHSNFWELVKGELFKVSEEHKKAQIEQKIATFKAGYGTILYFIDTEIVSKLSQNYPLFAPNFPLWAEQSNAMLQFMIWTSLSQRKIGASLQHYNPIIDDAVKNRFNVNPKWKLIAQMPFGGIAKDVESHEIKENPDRLIVCI